MKVGELIRRLSFYDPEDVAYVDTGERVLSLEGALQAGDMEIETLNRDVLRRRGVLREPAMRVTDVILLTEKE